MQGLLNIDQKSYPKSGGKGSHLEDCQRHREMSKFPAFALSLK